MIAKSSTDEGPATQKPDFMSPKSNPATILDPITLQEYYELEEIGRLRLGVLKKEETELLSDLDRLSIERDLHIREVRRIRDEDQASYLL